MIHFREVPLHVTRKGVYVGQVATPWNGTEWGAGLIVFFFPCWNEKCDGRNIYCVSLSFEGMMKVGRVDVNCGDICYPR